MTSNLGVNILGQLKYSLLEKERPNFFFTTQDKIGLWTIQTEEGEEPGQYQVKITDLSYSSSLVPKLRKTAL